MKITLVRKTNVHSTGHWTQRTGFTLGLLAMLSGLLCLEGCKEESALEPPALDHPCTSKTDCAYGMTCIGGICQDRGKENLLNNDGREPIEEMLKRDEQLQQQTEHCGASPECKNRGRCQGTPDGSCIVAEQAHCENAEITCKQEGKCTYVPEEYACCESKMGSVCERP